MASGPYGTREAQLNELGHKFMRFITQELHDQGVHIPSMVRFKFHTEQRAQFYDVLVRIEIIGNGKTLALSRIVDERQFIKDKHWMETEAKTMAAQIMLSGGCVRSEPTRQWIDEAARKLANTIDNRILKELE